MGRRIVLLVLGLLVVQASVLFLFGQPAICRCGYVLVWDGNVHGSGNSQHLSDWYSFSHIIHGIIFYFLLTWLFPHMSVWKRLVIALGIEVSWELIENTPLVIDAYRQQALAQGYTGDSIINSLSDSLMMLGGFLLAQRVPWWSVLALALMLEIFTGYAIHDGLMLNILNFIHVFPAVQHWQAAA